MIGTVQLQLREEAVLSEIILLPLRDGALACCSFGSSVQYCCTATECRSTSSDFAAGGAGAPLPHLLGDDAGGGLGPTVVFRARPRHGITPRARKRERERERESGANF